MPNKVQHTTYSRFREDYNKIEHCIEGERAVHENAVLYLRKMPGMSSQEFSNYSRGGAYYPVVDRTLRNLTGLALRNEPRIELPSRLEPIRLSATFDGNSLAVFIEEAMRQVLAKGRFLTVLDYPETGNDVNSVPYLATFQAENVLDWRASYVEGREVVTYLRLHEDNDDLQDGVEQHLVLTLSPWIEDPREDEEFDINERTGLVYKVRRYHVTNDAEVMVGEVQTPVVNGQPMREIPFVCFSPYNLTIDIEKPPMLDIANLSLKHYQNSCDYEHQIHLASQPTFVRKGAKMPDEKNDLVGPGAVWDLPTDGDAYVMEVSGAAAKIALDAMTAKEQQMSALGAKFITDSMFRNEAEGTASMRYRTENALLHSTVQMIEEGLAKLLRIAADWVAPGSSSQVEVEFKRDFVSSTLDANTVNALLKAWQAGAISHDTLLGNLRKGELLEADRSTQDEKDMIDEEGSLDVVPSLSVVPSGS